MFHAGWAVTLSFLRTKGATMEALRSEWTAEQISENLGRSHEGLPEATTTDRFPVEGTASGIDFRAGAEPYEQSPSPAERSGAPGLPADPPLRPAGLGD